MLTLAGEWRWAHTKEKGVDLEKLLRQMIDESNPKLPFGYVKLDEVGILPTFILQFWYRRNLHLS